MEATETQLEVLKSVREFQEPQRRRVAKLIRQMGGATDEEISYSLKMKMNSVHPRRRELVQKGLVRDSGRTRLNESNHPANVWEWIPKDERTGPEKSVNWRKVAEGLEEEVSKWKKRAMKWKRRCLKKRERG